MSCGYADGLSPYSNKGKLGLPEKFESPEKINEKLLVLANWIKSANHVVVHTGAGISTSAGIPDFRGPNGVWTLEAKGLKPNINISFDDAVPTITHMALVKLVETGKVQYIVSQNIDGLHLRSGIPREKIAELHGNMFTEQCNQCGRQIVRKSATTSVGKKCLNTRCPTVRRNGHPCRGLLYDTILDWEHDLPEKDLGMADFHSCVADLSICLGTTLQIVPSGNLPLHTKKYGGRLVICNLQPTKHDKKADMIIHGLVDDVMSRLMKLLGLPIPVYDTTKDPSKVKSDSFSDWTIEEKQVKDMRKLYESKCCRPARKRSVCKNIKEEKSSEDEMKLTNLKNMTDIIHSNTVGHSNVKKVPKLDTIITSPSVECQQSQDNCSSNLENFECDSSVGNACLVIEENVSKLTDFECFQSHSKKNFNVSSENMEKLQNSENKNIGCVDSKDHAISINKEIIQNNSVKIACTVNEEILQSSGDKECVKFLKPDNTVCLKNEACSTSGEAVLCAS